MFSGRKTRSSTVDSKKGWGCSYLFGCILVSVASVFLVGVMLAMIPSFRQLVRDQARRITGRSIETVTIPEGWNRFQVASRLENRGVLTSADEFLEVTEDPDILQAHSISGETAEGYLFPDTYEFYRAESPEEVLEIMLSNFSEKFDEIARGKAEDLEALSDLGDDPRHVTVILASIVEKEAVKANEQPLIAGVFLNRLLLADFPSRMLQADPSIAYGCIAVQPLPDSCALFDGKLGRRHLEDTTNPYNTYIHKGLPPGPIANPGSAALAAVLDPAETDYLYFVARGNGTHKFSRTLKQHKEAVKKFRRGGK